MTETTGFPVPDGSSGLGEVLGTAQGSDPVSVWQGEMTLLGVTLHLHVLSDGSRIIEAADVLAFFEAMERGDAELDESQIEAFARWQRGGALW